jgi:hypothetical protein
MPFKYKAKSLRFFAAALALALADGLGLKRSQIELISGETHPRHHSSRVGGAESPLGRQETGRDLRLAAGDTGSTHADADALAHTALRLGLRRLGYLKGPMTTNDRHGHAAILAALDAAIVEVMERKRLNPRPAPVAIKRSPRPRPPVRRKVAEQDDRQLKLPLPLWW